VLVASDAKATELGVPPDRRVYLRGWSSARDYPYVAENEELWRSRAMEAGVHHALRAAGLEVDDLDHFDLYSCFPASVRFALDALGRPLGDGRGVTVTGGMPSGAPGSGYVTQAIATMTETLRRSGSGAGLVSGLSAQMSTHAFTVLSGLPGAGDPRAFGSATALPASGERVVIREGGRGPAVLEAYAVACRHDSTDELAVAVCRLPDGSRCYTQARDTQLLGWLSTSEGVGRRVELAAGEGGLTEFMA
jgi:acetyl-CoA C-acetyltransferase